MARDSSSDSSSSNSSSSSSQDSVKFTSITVNNLSPNLTEAHVKEIFSNFGEIHSIGIRQNPKVKHYAVVNFKVKEDAEAAQSHMNSGQIDGMVISVQMEDTTKGENEKERSRSRSKRRSKPAEKK